MIKFSCPHCGVSISAEPEHYGASANCPTCGQDLVVPTDNPISIEQPVVQSTAAILPPVPGRRHEVPKSSGKKKIVKIGVPAVLCILLIVGVAVSSNVGKADDRSLESTPAQEAKPKQKTNRAGYDAYMTGYDNPEQGDAAEAMIDRFSGGDRQAALLMILGAEDRRKGLPVRFVVVSE
jgi:hypothetical protein